jgi:hypothetical protein
MQVKTKMPEELRYIKGTCYEGEREDFRRLCGKLFRQIPMVTAVKQLA